MTQRIRDLRVLGVTALCAIAPVSAAAQGGRGTIVSADMNANTASVVDIATGAMRATYPTTAAPHEVAISSDGKTAIISVYGDRNNVGHSLMIIDLTGGAPVRTIDLGDLKRPHGMRFLPGDKKLILTSEATQRVVIVDLAKGAVSDSVVLNQGSTHMVVIDRDGKRAFTTNINKMTISVIDIEHTSVIRTIEAGVRIEGIAINPNATEVWVGANDAKKVLVFNPATGEKVAELDGFGLPYRMSITPDGATAVISDPGSERIVIADAKTHTVRSTIDATKIEGAGDHPSPQGVILSRDGKTAFVTLKGLGKVAMIDIATSTVTKVLTVGGGSDGVGFSPLNDVHPRGMP